MIVCWVRRKTQYTRVVNTAQSQSVDDLDSIAYWQLFSFVRSFVWFVDLKEIYAHNVADKLENKKYWGESDL